MNKQSLKDGFRIAFDQVFGKMGFSSLGGRTETKSLLVRCAMSPLLIMKPGLVVKTLRNERKTTYVPFNAFFS